MAHDAGKIEEATSAIETGLDISKSRRETLNVPELPKVRGKLWLRTTPVKAAERSVPLVFTGGKNSIDFKPSTPLVDGTCRARSEQGRTAEAVDPWRAYEDNSRGLRDRRRSTPRFAEGDWLRLEHRTSTKE
jgi:hypothetical protein